ncbi:MAG: hypothetical protein EOO40_11825 [Deltaproteobacteria bacterium]|nr:MAG: hypothetical protein EOO40_11825 [Deltaproteobacteria bacterium]
MQQPCDAGINPVIEAVLKDRTGEFADLAGTRIAFDQPGMVCRDLLKPFYAHTALEATLAVGDANGAEYLLLADQACSAQQMAQAYARVDDFFHGRWALKSWFKRRLWARRLGLRGIYIDLNNPAGGWHTQLSRKRTQRALAKHRAVVVATDASRRQRFGHTVRGSALAGAVTARRIASPVTYATDFLLGTQRDEENGDRPTSPMARCLNGARVGGVFGASLVIVGGVAAYPLAAAVAPGLSYISARSLLWVEEKRYAAWYYGFDQPVLRPLAQTVATLGCVPKAVASGVGLGAGAIFGVAKGTAEYLAQRPA